jgi:hypothetical protein
MESRNVASEHIKLSTFYFRCDTAVLHYSQDSALRKIPTRPQVPEDSPQFKVFLPISFSFVCRLL